MKQLFLDGHVYNALYCPPNMEGCAAYAHIYYGTPEFPEDQFGKSISNCHNDDGISLENHLNTHVLPLLNDGLDNSPYIVLGMTQVNMVPEPLFIIGRRDCKQLEDGETVKIEKLLQDIIKKNNEKALKKSTTTDSGFFASKKPAAKCTPKSNLRPR